MKPIGTRTITTKRLVLRAPQAADAAALVAAGSLPMSLQEAEKALAAMAEEAAKPFGFHWVITLDGKAIGRVKGWDVSPYNGYLQLGYDIAPAYRGKGCMTEAVGGVIRYMLLQAEANRVYCSVRECNAASRRVCEKNGMRHEGVLRQHYARQDGGYDDVHIYGIIRDDLRKGSGNHGARFRGDAGDPARASGALQGQVGERRSGARTEQAPVDAGRSGRGDPDHQKEG